MNLKQKTFFILSLMALIGANAFAESEVNLGSDGIAVSGYDVVSYFKGAQPLKGSTQFQAKEGGATYLFATDADRQEFTKNPGHYVPQFGGWCAYAVAKSKSKVEVDPQSFLIQDDRLLLFYKGFWGDTREKWLHTQDKDSKTYLKEADTYWPAIRGSKP